MRFAVALLAPDLGYNILWCAGELCVSDWRGRLALDVVASAGDAEGCPSCCCQLAMQSLPDAPDAPNAVARCCGLMLWPEL